MCNRKQKKVYKSLLIFTKPFPSPLRKGVGCIIHCKRDDLQKHRVTLLGPVIMDGPEIRRSRSLQNVRDPEDWYNLSEWLGECRRDQPYTKKSLTFYKHRMDFRSTKKLKLSIKNCYATFFGCSVHCVLQCSVLHSETTSLLRLKSREKNKG